VRDRATTAYEALRLVKARHDVCAVVSDVSMPGAINGFELAHRIRKVRPRVGIVLVSGRTMPTGGELPYGVLFLSKPVRAVTLLRLLRQVLDRNLRAAPGGSTARAELHPWRRHNHARALALT